MREKKREYEGEEIRKIKSVGGRERGRERISDTTSEG